MKAHELADEAALIMDGDRAKTHGPKRENHQRIAKAFQLWLEIRPEPAAPLTEWDVANMMELLKIARRCTGDHNDDDYVDGGNYSFIAGELAKEEVT